MHRTRILYPVDIDTIEDLLEVETTVDDDGVDLEAADSDYGILSFSDELDEAECCLCQRRVCIRRCVNGADGCLVVHESWEC